MKISNSKKQLAKIISENGGWREGARFAAQDSKKDDYPSRVCFYRNKPVLDDTRWLDGGHGIVGGSEACIEGANQLFNWHQTILSRDEYFHLYPAPDAELVAMCADVTKENKHPEYCESVMRSIPEPSNKPAIEQLAADYRAKLAIAQQAQEEADSHRCGAEVALEKLVAAGKALGLALSVAAPEPELVINDWRDLQVGDWVWVAEEDHRVVGGEYEVLEVEAPGYDGKRTIRIRGGEGGQFWINYENGWRFIRRPAKGDANA